MSGYTQIDKELHTWMVVCSPSQAATAHQFLKTFETEKQVLAFAANPDNGRSEGNIHILKVMKIHANGRVWTFDLVWDRRLCLVPVTEQKKEATNYEQQRG